MFAARHILYQLTNSFSRIILDYLERSPLLMPFYGQDVSIEGIKQTIRQKEKQQVDRKTLVAVLRDQYAHLPKTELVNKNIEGLLSSKSFTICTAHQPNLFTGPLYFIYKILHVIKLSENLKAQLPDYNFIPVYYMGSEDADLAELNNFTVNGKRYEWDTNQTGAVGRMKVDKKIAAILHELEQQLSVEKFGPEFIDILKEAYKEGSSIQQATLSVVNRIFGKYGLLVLIADDPRLKRQMIPVFEEDLFQQRPSEIVEKAGNELGKYYKVQAHPREINLFYLLDNIRARIIRTNAHFEVNGTDIKFSEAEMSAELHEHPERFSPNVILRGLYQETILPGISFIGGGGELAYWLQLKALFENYKVCYPILILRNSIMVIEHKWNERINKLGLSVNELFHNESDLMKIIVARFSDNKISLNGNFEKVEALYEQVKAQAEAIDPTLSAHVSKLKTQSIKTLHELEKKMLRAEKRKFSDEQRQVQKIKDVLFPNNGLQERIENISGFYARWGSAFIDELYKASLTLEQQFTVLTHQKN